MMSNTPTRTEWQRARSFEALCELTARYVGGELAESPTSLGPIEAETSDVAEHLIALNRLGLLTLHSQPALRGRTFAQRACVSGFALKDLALLLSGKSLYTDLFVAAFPPGDTASGYMVPITVADGHPYTWAGRPNFEEFEQFAAYCGAHALEALAPVWSVTVIDLRWGRRDYLWRVLRDLSSDAYRPAPHPELGLDDEFIY